MSSGLNGLGTSRDLRSTLNLSTSIKLCALAPNCSYGVAVKAKSMAAVNSSGVALKGPSRWLGMMDVKSHEVTMFDQRLTSSRRRGNAKTAKMGGTNIGLATRASKSARQLGSHLNPSSKSLAMSPLNSNSTAFG